MPSTDTASLAIPGQLSETGLMLPDDLAFEEWQRLGSTLAQMERSILWWLGDWLNYGERSYGEKYSQALSTSEYAYQSLRNARWVANQFELSRRRDNLPWSHHAEVAALEPGEADAFLDLAESEEWNRRDLRAAVKRGLALALPPAGDAEIPSSADVRAGDFREVLADVADGSVDAIITDPPYPREFLALYGALGALAARVLRPGGSLLAMCGQSYLPEVLALLAPHLTYHWAVAYLTPGGQSPQIWQRQVNTFWKPVLWLVKPPYDGPWVGDVVRSEVNDNDKRHHHWGQSESGMADLVERFTAPGTLILDPFLGGGTTGVVALRLGRRFLGCDLDGAAVRVARARLADGAA